MPLPIHTIMKNFSGKTVLITGGASGIGRIMTRLFLERNAVVVIWDINETKIEEVLLEHNHKKELHAFSVDVSDMTQIKETVLKTKKAVDHVDILINNAGIIVGKLFEEHSIKDIQKTIDVNTTAPMLITQEFLGDMILHNQGQICNIASSAGIVANPKMSVYAASKWAVVGWSDSLRLEMKQLKRDIHITTILPYYISTGMFDGVQSRLPILKPEVAAATIVRAIEKRRKLLTIPGYLYHLTRISQGLLSINLFDWAADNIFGIYKTMNHFNGHQIKK